MSDPVYIIPGIVALASAGYLAWDARNSIVSGEIKRASRYGTVFPPVVRKVSPAGFWARVGMSLIVAATGAVMGVAFCLIR